MVHELVQLVLILLNKTKLTQSKVVDGSSESLDNANAELHNLLWKYLPLHKNFKTSGVQWILLDPLGPKMAVAFRISDPDQHARRQQVPGGPEPGHIQGLFF